MIFFIDIQIINYKCEDPKTQDLLDKDIITYITKQNELKAKETDVDIMMRENEIIKQKKDLEYVTAQKDNEIALKKKELEKEIRVKELELQIEEERKRIELFELKKENTVKEGEFEGRAQGISISAFIASIPDTVPLEEKLKCWYELRKLDTAQLLYSKVDKIEMLPPNSDIKHYNFNMDSEIGKKINNPLLLPAIINYSGNSK